MKVFAGRSKDKDILLRSSSGGLFTEISNYIIDEGGIVYAAGLNTKTNIIEHKQAKTKKERDNLCGSKYVQSYIGNTYKEIKNLIYDKKQVLFVGTPCQVDALYKYIGNKNNNFLTTCEIICHGVPSPIIWSDFIDISTRKKNVMPVKLAFREKQMKRKKTKSRIYMSDGSTVALRPYTRLFNTNKFLRPSCYKCPYCNMNRVADITIGDYWGLENIMPDFYSDQWGNSLIFINTDRGNIIWNVIKSRLEYRESNINECHQHNLSSPTKYPEERKQAWNIYYKYGIRGLLREFGGKGIRGKLKLVFRRINK